MKINRFTQYSFKNGMTIKNRVVVPPMASQTATGEGFVTSETIEHYRKLAQSQAGIVFVEYSYVHISGRGEANQLAVDSDEKISGLRELASTIHKAGALAGLQLVHVGGKTTTDLTQGYPLMAPSDVPVPVKGWKPEAPRPMTVENIQQWVKWFVEAAGRAVSAGFDIVELHAAHGYGLNQWLSPITNKRKDFFGGSIQGRSQLLLQIANEIKTHFPRVILAVRIPAQDNYEAGLTINEMNWVNAQLENSGVDIIDVSSGIGGWRRPEGQRGQGYLVGDAALLKSQTSLPIIGVGGIETGEFIDEILQANKVDFAAVGRELLKAP